jgi:hypothetical protein
VGHKRFSIGSEVLIQGPDDLSDIDGLTGMILRREACGTYSVRLLATGEVRRLWPNWLSLVRGPSVYDLLRRHLAER